MEGMKGVKTFLESSTIHGLAHISTTRKYSRLFWILAVLGGFSTAIYLIYKSFESWHDSPYTTTIETLSISEIKLPKVTVCPPKNTYTDLNYDLMRADNVVLTDEIRDELFDYALDVIWDQNDIFGKLNEENRYFNWYNGLSEVKSLNFHSYYGLQYFIDTTALSGSVTTQYYGQRYQADLVDKFIEFKVFIHPSETDQKDNITLHFQLEKVAIRDVSSDRFDRYKIDGYDGTIEPDTMKVYTNITNTLLVRIPWTRKKKMHLWRYVGKNDLESNSMEKMPGFRFRWWYTGANFTVEPKYSKFKLNKMFIK